MIPKEGGDNATLLFGDCRELLHGLPAGGAQAVVTSPPYWGLRDYGSDLGLGTIPEYVEGIREVFVGLRHALADDGVVWLNIGDTFSHSGSGSHGATGGSDKSTLQGSLTTGAVPTKRAPSGLPAKNLCGIPWRVGFALQDDGWFLRQAVIWHKLNSLPDAATDRPSSDYETVFMLTKRASYFYDSAAVKQDALWQRWGKQTVPKYEGSETASGWMKARDDFSDLKTKNLRSVWPIPTANFPGDHQAVMPLELASLCVAATTRKTDVVLDPFAGTGTTLVAALRLGRRGLGIEANPEYLKLAKKRVAEWWKDEPRSSKEKKQEESLWG